jgi:hypothetical protein
VAENHVLILLRVLVWPDLTYLHEILENIPIKNKIKTLSSGIYPV